MDKFKLDVKLIIDSYNNVKKNGINIDNPISFKDKINWIKIFDCSDKKTYCTDKIKVHNYCKDILGKDICCPILSIYNSVDEINLDILPQQFVIKCNHGCGYNLIVKDKNKININVYKKILNDWLNSDFSCVGGELQYHNINPKIFSEKYLGDNISDYKIWCFDGEPECIFIHHNRYLKNKSYYNVYNMDFIPIHIRCDQNIDPNLYDKKPKNFDLMIQYSKQLSKEFNFVRVDFYEVDDILYLGELTFTPANGLIYFISKDIDMYYSDKIRI
jgi:hypothetical protein